MHRVNVFVCLAIWGPVYSLATCDGDVCKRSPDGDETSLMQVGKVLNFGNQRKSEADQDLSASSASGIVCEEMGVVGTAPYCDGNENDCTANGLTVKMYVSEASEKYGEACETGQKVVCEKCDEPVPTTTTGTPTTTTTTTATTTTSTTTTTTTTSAGTTMSTASTPPLEPPAPAPELNVTQTELTVDEALDNLESLKKELANATKLGDKIAENVSKAEADYQQYTDMAIQDRAAAVAFAKNKALANQSIQRAELAMDDALTGETAASSQAKVEETEAVNAAKDKVHYRKLLVDQEATENAAIKKLELGKVGVHKAYYNDDVAHHQDFKKAIFDSHHSELDKLNASIAAERAKKQAVKDTMEDAFIASSLDRAKNNTPSYGEPPAP